MIGTCCSSSCLQMALTATVYFMIVLTTCSTNNCTLQVVEERQGRAAFLTKTEIRLFQIKCLEDSCNQSYDKTKKIERTDGTSVQQENQPTIQNESCGSVICNQTSNCVETVHGKICMEASTNPKPNTVPPVPVTTQDSDPKVSASTTDMGEDLTPSKTDPPAPVTTQDSDPHATPSQATGRKLYSASKTGHLQKVKGILAAGHVDINTRGGWWRRTPAMIAARKGHRDVVEFLVARGADVSLVDLAGNNLLHHACRSKREDLEIVKLILSLKNVDINARNNFGKTAADWARDRGHQRVLYLLVSRGAH